MRTSILRTVVYENSVIESIDRAVQNHRMLAKAVEGLEWIIVRNPFRGKPAGDGLWVYVASGDALAQTPDIRVTYRFDDAQIYFLKIQFAESESNRDLEFL